MMFRFHTLTLLLITLFVNAIQSQSLPIDFENGLTTADFVNFDGGTAAVIANPFNDTDNPSAQVGQIVRDGGETFAGSKIVLENNVDFSILTKVSMDVYTTAPVGTVIKMKFEGTGNTAESDAVTTVSGSWETLEWVFTGASNELNELVLMFDFGNVGDGSAASTFYFDNIEQIAGPPNPQPVSLPLDFEGGTVTTDFRSFAGPVASVIANPVQNANNPSATVAQVVRDGGAFFGGSFLELENDLDLSTDWVLSMKVYTEAPAGTRLKIELEKDGVKSFVDYVTTQTAAWETATFNFSGTPSDRNIIIFFFDFGNIGDGSATSTFLFDDVELISGPAIPAPTEQSLPITFEDGIEDSDLDAYFGAVSSVVANPAPDATNSSATVGRVVRSGGAPWAQTRIITDKVFDLNEKPGFSMKVYTDAPVGTTLKFKINSEGDGFANEKDILTTVSGAWETYTWDFSGDPSVYDRLTLMLGYGVTNDASAQATLYFDDIMRIPETLSAISDKNNELRMYPNPVKDHLFISSSRFEINEIQIFNASGALISTEQTNKLKLSLDTNSFASGIYFLKMSTEQGSEIRKFVKL